MHRRLIIAFLLWAAGAVAVLAQEGRSDGQAAPRIVAYYTSWSIYAHQYYVTDIPADKLTHINYAFFNISVDGGCMLGDEIADIQYRYPDDPESAWVYGNFRQLHLLRDQHPHLQILMSIGGLTWSSRFSDVALTDASRQRFVRSCVALLLRYEFDGIDLDWEFPVLGLTEGRPEDKENFTALIAEFRRQLNDQGILDSRHYLLTIAAPTIARFYTNIELDKIHQDLDWINLMCYGFAGRWSEITNHDSRLYASSDDPNRAIGRDTNAAVMVYLDAGVPAEKIVVGVPFYGRGWGGVPAENGGLYQSYDYLPEGTWAPGFYDFSDLQSNYFPSYMRYWDHEAQSAWLYNPAQAITISYEDPRSLRAKASYVRQHGLGGMMFWELANDDDHHTLLNTLYAALNYQP